MSDAGLRLSVLRPHAGDQLPADLDDYAGLVVLGGGMGAGEDAVHLWLPRTRALLAEAVAREIPTLGVCLGAQLLAVATGGRVGPNPDGPEYGAQLVAKRANAATDPLFGSLPITPDVIQWHVDAVLDLPPAAIGLASSPTCEVQAFRVGRLAWGIQFHIETTPQVLRDWAEEDVVALADYDVEAILARADSAHADVAEAWQPFAVAFAAVIADPAGVAPARPMRISTADPITDPAAIRAALAAEMQSARQLPWPSPRPE